jgi:hypothetical protein
MATKTIAGHPTPLSPDQDPTDLLEATLAQLEALMWTCHGEDIDWRTDDGSRQLANLHWLAYDMTRKAGEYFQLSTKALRAAVEARR